MKKYLNWKYLLCGIVVLVVIIFCISKLFPLPFDKENADVPTVPAPEIVNDEMVVPETMEMPKEEMKKMKEENLNR